MKVQRNLKDTFKMVRGGLASITFLTCTAMVLVACGSSSASTSGVTAGHASSTTSTQANASGITKIPAKPTTISVIWQPSGEFDYYYATNHKLWSKFGLKVVPREIVTGPEELAAMASNSADFAYMGIPPGITGISKGINMVAITSGPDEALLDGLYAPASSRITSLKDLVGKTIGVPKDTTANVDMYLALKKAGVPWTSVKVRYMNPPQLIPALARGQIQGAWVWDAWGQMLVQAGYPLLPSSVHQGVADAAQWWVQRSFLASHPGAVARFVATLAYSAKLADKNPGAVISEYASIANINHSEAYTIWKDQPALTLSDLTSPTEPLSYYNSSSGILKTVQQAAAALVALGDLPAMPSKLSQAIDTVPMHEAAKILATS